MTQYPIEFHVSAHAKPGKHSTWTLNSASGDSQCAIPKEFSGSGAALSPEDLFGHALTACFIGTFKVLAENSKLTYESLHCEARLIVAPKDGDRAPVMRDFFLDVKIKGAPDEAKTRILAKKAFESGFILNSVKTNCGFGLELIQD